MSIKIIDGFNVGVEKSIDDRFVVGPDLIYIDRESIENKYEGLRVWDLNDTKSYVWSGATWSAEISNNGSMSGSASYIPVYSSEKVITNSIIKQLTNTIIHIDGSLAINTTTPGSSKLTVNGGVSIGTNTSAATNGLIVQGSVSFNGLSNSPSEKENIVTISDTGELLKAKGGLMPFGGIILSNGDTPVGFVLCDGLAYEANWAPGGIVTTPDMSAGLSGLIFIMYLGYPIVSV